MHTKTQRPPLYKVILLNDDYTPRELVVLVLKAVFRMNEDQAYRVFRARFHHSVLLMTNAPRAKRLRQGPCKPY